METFIKYISMLYNYDMELTCYLSGGVFICVLVIILIYGGKIPNPNRMNKCEWIQNLYEYFEKKRKK